MIGTSRVKWTNCLALTGGAELQIIYRWCPRFFGWFGRSIDPGAIANDMRDRNIIEQVEAASFANGDGWLREGGIAHMGFIVVSACSCRTCCAPTAWSTRCRTTTGDEHHGSCTEK